MNLITYLQESRGLSNSARRLGVIGRRFGISHARMRGALNELVRICGEAKATPTLFVTAVLIERHPEFFRDLAASGAELAVHGYVHTDHALLGEREQYEALERALEAFERLGLQPRGFRHPYLRYNDATWSAASRLGFTWASNSSVHWDVVEENLPPEALGAYFRGLRLYGSAPGSQRKSLPHFVCNGLGSGSDSKIIDIPASLPDDEAVIDRLGLTGRDAGAYWLRMLDQSHERGEVMALVVHNERVPLVANSLRAVLRSARKKSPAVWIATLGEINDWWRKRSAWRLRVESAGDGCWRVIPPDDHEASVLVRNADCERAPKPWHGEWDVMPPWPFIIRSEKEPLVLDGPEDDDAPPDQPLLCLGRWPDDARSALALTSDVDAMTLLDFLRRPLEV